jgi:Glycosyl transferase family 2
MFQYDPCFFNINIILLRCNFFIFEQIPTIDRMSILTRIKKALFRKRIVMTLLVRDEEDLLEVNIKYHLSVGVNFFIITDNNSVDNTRAIIKKYEKKGIAKYIYESDDDYSQSKWVTRMARMAHEEYGAEWVINNDADEFWWTPTLKLKKEFKAIPEDIGVVFVDRHNFIPRPETGKPFYETMDIKEKRSLDSLGRPLEHKSFHRGSPSVVVAMGNHSATVPGFDKKIPSATMEIFHFPLRSYKQFENKIVKGGAALIRNKEFEVDLGDTWRKLFAIHEKGELFDYYNTQLFTDEQIETNISENILVKDSRLTNHFKRSKIK